MNTPEGEKLMEGRKTVSMFLAEWITGHIGSALRAELQQQRELLEDAKTQIGALMGKHEDIKAGLQANTAILNEVVGDLGELKDQNTQLQAKVDELQQQVNNPLLDEIATLVGEQKATLTSLAAVVPEPEPPVEPPTEPTNPPTEPTPA